MITLGDFITAVIEKLVNFLLEETRYEISTFLISLKILDTSFVNFSTKSFAGKLFDIGADWPAQRDKKLSSPF